MGDTAGVTNWWGLLAAPALLAALAYAAAAGSAALNLRASGGSASLALAAPAREAAGLLLRRPRTVPGADTLLWRAGIATVPVAAVMAVLVVPLGGPAIADLSIGVVWFNAMEVLLWGGMWLAGWGANSVWGLVGGYRYLAQGLAHELPHMFALTTAALGAGSLRVSDIAAAQRDLWFVLVMPVAFAVYLVSALAMSLRPPFDHPAGADAAGGAAAEPAGPDRLVLLAGRHLMLAAAAAMAVPLFLGGGAGPLLPGWTWSLFKTAAVLALLVWAGGRLPTVRMERFAEAGWVVLLPLVLLQALAVSVLVVAGGV
ncbi:NADH-quinone oxidoreductase subunit H [Streptomonospora wellingtoniae]|uniref:NADH-quinone oxidoreductase subunit H n=1 Tax=Streptomonospora wellingtoniae TaxID=3075544 RepID=A0ABU2KX06_9ACTN|nr:NADH-quinone oxidoreductase subunit H [Streptomonospora sp. DSM 45055]MDT0303697.1 NADH-quinone oxidoreductase subunit H [Streptomonospora sp. DSM 45055]